MERGDSYFSPAGANDPYIRDDQSFFMAAVRDWQGRAKLENRSGHRASGHHGVSHRITSWTQRRRSRLFHVNGPMGRSAYCVVRSRHSDFGPRHIRDPQPAAVFRHYGHCGFLRIDSPFRRIAFSANQTLLGKRSLCQRIPRHALVRDGAEIILCGSLSGIEGPILPPGEKLDSRVARTRK